MSRGIDGRADGQPSGSSRGWLHTDIRWRRVGRVALIVVVALVGAWIGLLVGGERTEQVGPLIVTSTVTPSLTGDSVVEVPPLGTITLDSHDGPLKLTATIEGIDSDATSGLLNGAASVGNREDVLDDIRSLVIGTYLRAVLVATLGALLATLFVWRSRRLMVICGTTVLALFAVTAGMAALTWNDRALAQPHYSGLLVYVPRVVGTADEVVNDFEKYGDQLARLVDNVSKLSSTITSLPTFEPDPGTVRVLHVSDIHLNPNVWPIMRTIVEQYDVNVVVDTGDIADQGTAAEAQLLDPIGTLGVPYIYVRGNHDSSAIEAAIAANSNAIVLDGEAVEVEGLTFLGSGDPRFTPDKDTADTADDVLLAQGDELARIAETLPEPPDVIAVHDPTVAQALTGSTPLVLAGHVHERRDEMLDDDTELLVQGSTGGAGLRALESEDPTPLTFTVLYFDRETGTLQARDEITLGGLGTSTAEVTRILSDRPPEEGTP